MSATKTHRVLATNPRSSSGEAGIVVRGPDKYYLIIPIDKDLFEIHFGGKYLGESSSLSGAESFIQRGSASAPVLIKNPSGGYEMFKYKSPTKSNPKKKRKKAKKKATKRKAKKKVTKRKTKKKAKKKSTKKKATKRKVAKRKTKKKATKKRAKKKVTKRKTKKKATKKRAKKKSTKKKATKKRTSSKKRKSTKKKAASKGPKVSIDAAVRNHITKKTGTRPNW